MEGLFFLVSCVAIGLIALWMMQNDRIGPRDRTIGFFAMRSSGSDEPGKTTQRRKAWVRRQS